MCRPTAAFQLLIGAKIDDIEDNGSLVTRIVLQDRPDTGVVPQCDTWNVQLQGVRQVCRISLLRAYRRIA